MYQAIISDVDISAIVGTSVYNTPKMSEVTNLTYPHINLFSSSTYPYGEEVRRITVTINSREDSASGAVDQSRELAFLVSKLFHKKNWQGSNNRYYTKASVIVEDTTTLNNPVQIGVDIIGED
jgi:hypothetical protein